MTHPIRVLINGAAGKMGQEAVKALSQAPDLVIVGKTGRQDNLEKTLRDSQAEVAVDLTSAETVFKNAEIIIAQGVHPVIGTSGLLGPQINLLKKKCDQKKLGGIIVPNFSIGIVLMMLFAKQAAAYFPNCEIIEMHHAQKKDSPSGTAVKTAEFIDRKQNNITATETETIKGARGALHHHIPIHSIRLPGLVAHQEILFGGDHELLTLRHDTFHRAAYMPGILLAIREVIKLKQLVYGLEHVLKPLDCILNPLDCFASLATTARREREQ